MDRGAAIETFPIAIRPYVARLAAGSPVLADLAETYPALLFALATGFGTPRQQETAFRAVASGQPLRICAAALGLPTWTRRLPASAFAERFNSLPDGEEFAQRIVDHLPAPDARAATWLSRIVHAHESCGSDFALWFARSGRARSPDRSAHRIHQECAWAWHGRHPEIVAGSLVATPWSADLGPRRVAEATTTWFRRAELATALSSRPDLDALEPLVHNGFTFQPLSMPRDFIAESIAMANCLDHYADPMKTPGVHVVSVRWHGSPIANLELHAPDGPTDTPRVIRLLRARNRPAGPGLKALALNWAKSLPGERLRQAAAQRGVAIDRARLAFFEPYLSWLPAHRATEFELFLRAAAKPATKPSRPTRRMSEDRRSGSAQ